MSLPEIVVVCLLGLLFVCYAVRCIGEMPSSQFPVRRGVVLLVLLGVFVGLSLVNFDFLLSEAPVEAGLAVVGLIAQLFEITKWILAFLFLYICSWSFLMKVD